MFHAYIYNIFYFFAVLNHYLIQL